MSLSDKALTKHTVSRATVCLLLWLCPIGAWALYPVWLPISAGDSLQTDKPLPVIKGDSARSVPLLAATDTTHSVTDTLPPAKAPVDAVKVALHKPFVPNSTIALLCAVIPGGGQMYNRKYWKVPIVLSAACALSYLVGWNATQFNEYHTAYRDFMDDNPLAHDSWKSFVPPGDDPANYVKDSNIQNRLKRGTEQYQRSRDFYLIISAVVYLLSFVDTYVDAQMFTFDISPDLTMAYGGHFASPRVPYPTAIGLTCKFNF